MTSDLHREARELLDASPMVCGARATRVLRDLLAEVEEAQAWAAWFAAERDTWEQRARRAADDLIHRMLEAERERDEARATLDRIRGCLTAFELINTWPLPDTTRDAITACAGDLRRALNQENQ